MQLSKRMGLDNRQANAGRRAIMRLISAAADAPNPTAIVQKALALDPNVFRANAGLLGSNGFLGAAKANDWVAEFALEPFRF
jgi:hypothetical protein